MSLTTRLGPGGRQIFPLRTSRGARACLFCSLSQRTGPPRRPKSPYTYTSRRRESTVAIPSQQPASDPRTLLIEALQDLKKHAPNHVNLSRLQLALQGMQAPPGHEPIRVAVWALSDGPDAGSTAREMLRLLLADPLKERQPWEEDLGPNDTDRPLVVRVGPEEADTTKPSALITTQADLLREIHVSSPMLNGLGLEFLLINANFSADSLRDRAADMPDDAVLVPTVDIESAPGRYTPITTPVHKSLVISRGIGGVAVTAALPIDSDGNLVLRAADLPGLVLDGGEQGHILPVDVAKASKGVSLLRKDISHAVEYEHLWYESGLPAILDWLRGSATSEPGKTKPAVRSLVASLLQTTAVGLRAAEIGRLSSDPARRTGPAAADLREGLARWAEDAHAELRDQLDLAFAGRRWRKLGWWKLFWRADDVAALATQMLGQSFLPSSEKKVIYLAGRIQSAVGSQTAETIRYAPPSQTSPASQDGAATSTPSSLITGQEEATEWPTHISFTRRYLEHETVPALQALAQRLVVQAAGTSGLGCALSALLYVSSSVTGLYEAGAVAALAVVWSLRRMQKRWETARDFWEGEVREEGRKSVRAVELSLGQALETQTGKEVAVEEDAEVAIAREIVARAEDALARLE